MEQACRSPASFLVVDSATPGRSLDVRDVMTGRRFHVLEQAASQTFQPGDLSYSRVLTLDGVSILLGACPLVIPPEWHLTLLDMRERWRPGGFLTRADLDEYVFELLDAYHDIAHAVRHPQLPQLSNTDGDPLELTTLTYSLSVPPAEAIARLEPLVTSRGERHVSDEVVDAEGRTVSATLSWLKRSGPGTSFGGTLLGSLRIEGRTLTVDVNSARRVARIKREITKRLGSDATLVQTDIQDLGELLAGRHGDAGRPEAGNQPSPELAAIEAAMVREHMRAWLDTKIPALGDHTPREAVRTASGRERVEALLVWIARTSDGMQPEDMAELRLALGLEIASPDRFAPY